MPGIVAEVRLVRRDSLSTTLERHLDALGVITLLHADYRSGECVYCGETADTMDHLLPRGWTGDALRKRVPVVPACRECNSTLGDRLIPEVQERRHYVHNRYRSKYRNRLRTVVLGSDDLAELGDGLRGAVIRQIAEHDRLMDRLSWPKSPTYDADALSGSWEEQIQCAERTSQPSHHQ